MPFLYLTLIYFFEVKLFVFFPVEGGRRMEEIKAVPFS